MRSFRTWAADVIQEACDIWTAEQLRAAAQADGAAEADAELSAERQAEPEAEAEAGLLGSLAGLERALAG